jgi:hypothetical protein
MEAEMRYTVHILYSDHRKMEAEVRCGLASGKLRLR